jgi:hypothetical protein
MTRKEINQFITDSLEGWAKGYSVECHADVPNWDGVTISLTEMRKVAQPGEMWFLDRWHNSKSYKDDMRDITIPKTEASK